MKKKVFAILAVLVSAFGVFWMRAEPANDPKLAFDRIWISHMPQSQRDKVSLFAMLTEEEIGIFQENSMYQGNFDLFGFAGGDGSLTIHMLQDNKKVKATYTASRCEVKGFDFCLEIKGSPRGPVKYFSRKGWEIDSTGDVQDLAQKIEKGLPEE